MIVRAASLFAVLALCGVGTPALAQSDAPPLPPLDEAPPAEAYPASAAEPGELPLQDNPGMDGAYARELARAGWIQQCSAALSRGQCEDYLRGYEQAYVTALGGSITYGLDAGGEPAMMWVRMPNCR